MSISAYDRIEYGKLSLPSLQEMLVAPTYLSQRHDEMSDQISALEGEANKAALLASETPEGTADKAYKAYMEQLQGLSSELSEKGVGRGRIKSMVSSTKAAYNRDIAPILQAGELQKLDFANKQAADQADPTRMDASNPQDYTIDAYLTRGNKPVAANAISGNQIRATTTAKIAPLAAQYFQENPELKNIGLEFQHLLETRSGISIDEALNALQGNYTPEQKNAFGNFIEMAINSTLDQFGVYDKFKDRPDLIKQSELYAKDGIYAAIGKATQTPITDMTGMARFNVNLSEASQIRLANHKHALDKAFHTWKEGQKPPEDSSLMFNTMKYFPEERESTKKADAALKDLGLLYGETPPPKESFPGVPNGPSPDPVQILGKKNRIITNLQSIGINPYLDKDRTILKSKEDLKFEIEQYNNYSALSYNENPIPFDDATRKVFIGSLTAPDEKLLKGLKDVFVRNSDGAIVDYHGKLSTTNLGEVFIRHNGKTYNIPPDLLGTTIANEAKGRQLATIAFVAEKLGDDAGNTTTIQNLPQQLKQIADTYAENAMNTLNKAYSNVELELGAALKQGKLSTEDYNFHLSKAKIEKEHQRRIIYEQANKQVNNDLSKAVNYTNAPFAETVAISGGMKIQGYTQKAGN